MKQMQAYRDVGLTHLPFGELADLCATDTSPGFVRDMLDVFPSTSVQDLIGLRSAGVDPVVARAAARTHPDLTPEQLRGAIASGYRS